MRRRSFLKGLIGGAGMTATAALARPAAPDRLLIQKTPLAGFHYHQAAERWAEMQVGEALTLQREPNNPHDPAAAAIYRGPERLGYLRRKDNTAISQMLDRGQALSARISELRDTEQWWERVWVSVHV